MRLASRGNELYTHVRSLWILQVRKRGRNRWRINEFKPSSFKVEICARRKLLDSGRRRSLPGGCFRLQAYNSPVYYNNSGGTPDLVRFIWSFLVLLRCDLQWKSIFCFIFNDWRVFVRWLRKREDQLKIFGSVKYFDSLIQHFSLPFWIYFPEN